MLGQGPFGRPNLAALAGDAGLSIAPALFVNQNLFFAPTITTQGVQNITPTLWVDPDGFPAPAVTTGNSIVPQTWIDPDQFFAPAITTTVGISPTLWQNQNQFFDPTIVVQQPLAVTPALFDSSAGTLFFTPFIDLQLKDVFPSFWRNSNLFFAPDVRLTTPEGVYTYPIGNDLGSDYGMRESLTFYKQRLVLGHRHGRRR